MTDDIKVKKRKRGVKASRTKLEQALLNAGLKTQAALALKIAEIEDTENVPKDLVNKVFREVSVSTASIARIARALDVAPDTLLASRASKATSPSSTSEHSNDQTVPEQPQIVKYTPMIIGLLLIITSTIGYYALTYLQGTNHDSMVRLTSLFPHLEETVGRYSIAIRASSNLQPYMHNAPIKTTETYTVTPTVTFYDKDVGHYDIPNKQVDLTVTLNAQITGRFVSLDAFIGKRSRIHVWQVITTTSMLEQNMPMYSAQLAKRLALLLQEQLTQDQLLSVDESNAVALYLDGRHYLDHSSDIEQVKSAQSRFYLVIDQTPNFSLAYAGLCQAYLYESWSGDEKTLLAAAQKNCQKALELTPSHPYVVASNAFLSRRSGQIAQGIAQLTDYLEQHEPSAEVLHELAYLKLEAFRQSGDNSDMLEQGKELLKQAQVIAPDWWKVYATLGLIEWSAGHLRASIEAYQQALLLNENDLLLANLGTFSFCVGDIEPAKSYYLKVVNKSPDSYLGHEMMGMLYYFAQQYAASVDSRLLAIQLAGDAGIQQMWGALGDSYAMLESRAKAIDSYRQALLLIEREFARGNQTQTDLAHQYYYQIKLNLLGDNTFEIDSHLLNQLDAVARKKAALDSSAIVRLALSYFYVGKFEQAKSFLTAATERCKVYEQLPEWQRQTNEVANYSTTQ